MEQVTWRLEQLTITMELELKSILAQLGIWLWESMVSSSFVEYMKISLGDKTLHKQHEIAHPI